MNNLEKRIFSGRGIVRFLLFILLVSIDVPTPGRAQVSGSGIQEEQDYTFAYGLYQDKLYQLAADQFQKFIDHYPSSVRKPDAIFLYAECRFAQGGILPPYFGYNL